MGLAILVIYIPTFLIVTAISISISKFIIRETHKADTIIKNKKVAYFFGVVIALMFSTAFAWWYSKTAHGMDSIIIPIAISLFGPLIIGIGAFVLSEGFRNSCGNIFPSSSYFAHGALQSTVAMPLLGILIYASFDGIYNFLFRPLFEKLCIPAKVQIFEAVEHPKGFAVTPRWVHPRRFNQSDPVSLLLSEKTPLQFVEEINTSPTKYEEKIVRVTRKYNQETQISDKRYEELFSTTPVDSLISEYNVKFSEIDVPRVFEFGGDTSGQRIEIARAYDGKIIATAEGYWNYQQNAECPPNFSDGEFVINFVSKAFGIPNASK